MQDILSAVPVIVSLVIIEGLLSVDNALAIAAIASGLPENQKKKALRYGILGAYLMRGLCLFFAAWIARNRIVKLIGAIWLIGLMIRELFGKEKDGAPTGPNGRARRFIMVVINIELMDLFLSIDNVVAAVALDQRLWVVCLGVFIGIAMLRFVAGFCIRLIEKHPILKTTAFLLVGYVGAILIADMHYDHVPSLVKFGGIFTILGVSLIYEKIKSRLTGAQLVNR